MVAKNLTSKEAARILGVSEASVKRWADSGLLPAIRTAGGHRRFQPADIAFFQHSSAKQSAPLPAPKIKLLPADRAKLVDRMLEALLKGRSEEVLSLFINLSLQGESFARIADEFFCPAFRNIGRSWRHGELSIAQEHLASRCGLDVLQRLRSIPNVPARDENLAICCSTENDFHELPLQIAVLTLENLGWKVINLGCSTPFFVLREAVEKYKPRLVCAASTILHDLDRAAAEFRDLRRTAENLNISVVLGGAGFAGEIRPRFAADLHADTFSGMEDFAATLTL